MKKLILAVSAFAALGFAGANAGDHENDPAYDQFVQGCEAYKAEYGSPVECPCLAKKVVTDEEFAAEMMTVMGPEDLGNLSEASLEKIAACEPTEEEE